MELFYVFYVERRITTITVSFNTNPLLHHEFFWYNLFLKLGIFYQKDQQIAISTARSLQSTDDYHLITH